MKNWLPLALCIASPALGDVYDHLPLACDGLSPEWSMVIAQDGTEFDGPVTADLDIAWVTTAEDTDWPVALTLIGRGTSAIVILEPPIDGAQPVRVLTQRGETPLLLTGSCAGG